jgi:hypothetical protein
LRSTLYRAVLVAGLLAVAQEARAQEVSAYFGLGSAYVTSNGSQIDTFGDGVLHHTPSLDGLFADLGASVFVNKNVGIGAQLAWTPSQGNYAGLQYRPSFYNFDGIYRPDRGATKRFAPEYRLGIGGARVRYTFDDQTACDQVPGCPDSTHFQVHLAAAVRWYWTDHIFLRPALDLHYVVNFNEFGSNWVPRYSMGIGYSFGRE